MDGRTANPSVPPSTHSISTVHPYMRAWPFFGQSHIQATPRAVPPHTYNAQYVQLLVFRAALPEPSTATFSPLVLYLAWEGPGLCAAQPSHLTWTASPVSSYSSALARSSPSYPRLSCHLSLRPSTHLRGPTFVPRCRMATCPSHLRLSTAGIAVFLETRAQQLTPGEHHPDDDDDSNNNNNNNINNNNLIVSITCLS